MTRKNYSAIPAFAALILIPQLLFWWLSPASAPAFWPVYIGGTLLTAGVPLAAFLTYLRRDIRRTAGLFLVSGLLGLLICAESALLLAARASARSAVYALVISALVSIAVMPLMITSVLKEQRQGIRPAAAEAAEEDLSREPRITEKGPKARRDMPDLPARRAGRPENGTPLPPRNR